ncbi:MAG: hypothetical protein EHM80_02355 [Nitrospiraceae bacterium]|nr:MAG: hypothetical protein EHM80_02355 [Nitrospiraceae bacterium]
MQHAIFHYGGLHREPQEFLFGLRIRHIEFDIQIIRQGTHENLQAVWEGAEYKERMLGSIKTG